MALEEIKLWAMDGAGGATPLASAAQTESERLLEDTLVNNPDMLVPGLTLVGRQTRTEGGPLDLLGVDRDGGLALFELKRGSLNRDAVAQIIDYGSFLESMDDNALAQHIAEHSGSPGIDKIEDFSQWYSENRGGQELNELRPVRLFLVGLGVDDTTVRMVRFLADRKVDISLLTFLGFSHGKETFLARQMPVESIAGNEDKGTGKRRLGRSERRHSFDNRLREWMEEHPEARDLWNATMSMFHKEFPHAQEVADAGKSDWINRRLGFQLFERKTRYSPRYVSVQLGPIDQWTGLLNVVFHSNAVAMFPDGFASLRKHLPSESRSRNERDEVWFKLDSLAEWETHKEKLAEVTRAVYEAHYASEDE